MTEKLEQEEVKKVNPEAEGETPAEEVCFQSSDVERMLAAIAEKNRLHEEMAERLKRLQADFDNFRRRTRQEKEELSGIVTEGILLKLLPVIDNFDRALSTATDNADVVSFRSGVEMIYRQLFQSLEQLGLAPVKAVGETFNPQQHEAVMRVEAEDQADGLIVEEFQKGYMVRNKVIRPSMVKVVSNN